jgi:hypothetical protein
MEYEQKKKKKIKTKRYLNRKIKIKDTSWVGWTKQSGKNIRSFVA